MDEEGCTTHGTRMLALVGLVLAVAGLATAQNAQCPECDPDGPGGTNSSYSNVDLGVIDEDDLDAISDTDVSASDGDNETFFVWLSFCLTAFLENVGGLLESVGIDLDANAEAYVNEHGVDLDATITAGGGTVFDFDDSPVGDIDVATWDVAGDVREQTGLDVDGGVGDLVPEGLDVDLCLNVEIQLVSCEG